MKEQKLQYLEEIPVGIRQMEERIEEGKVTIALKPTGLGNWTSTTSSQESVT